MRMTRQQLQSLALLGAQARRQQLLVELSQLDKVLGGGGQILRRKRKPMSAAARKLISARMKAMWRRKRSSK